MYCTALSPGLTPSQIRNADLDRRLDGRIVSPDFEVHRINKVFCGIVQSRVSAAGKKAFRIYYEDSDKEDISFHKLPPLLLP